MRSPDDSNRARAGRRVAGGLGEVVGDHLVASPDQPEGHVAPHAAQTHHPDLHAGSLPFRSAHRAEVVDCDPYHPPPVLLEALVVTEGLGGEESTEVVGMIGYFDEGLVAGPQELDGQDAVRSSLVELAGGVEEAGPVTGGHRCATEPV